MSIELDPERVAADIEQCQRDIESYNDQIAAKFSEIDDLVSIRDGIESYKSQLESAMDEAFPENY